MIEETYLRSLLDAIKGRIIIIWKFNDAPKYFRDLSENGGDEDWVAFVPDALKDEYIGFLDEGSSFGCCTVEEHDVDGGRIYIGCHA